MTPESKFDEGDFRNHYFRGERKLEVYNQIQEIVTDLNISIEDMAETALRYILSHPAVSTVIPGMRTIKNVEKNCKVGDGKGLSQESVKKLQDYRWIRNFYQA
ncbi:aldo/keto reductase [Neobacillus drentensis]|uniref:aldo/keto reductase n=1 Tax=Neobacillus drentensis TaxID=220684 RepID=UPI003D2F73EF